MRCFGILSLNANLVNHLIVRFMRMLTRDIDLLVHVWITNHGMVRP